MSPAVESPSEPTHVPHLSLEILRTILGYSDHETLLKCRSLSQRLTTLVSSLLAESMAHKYQDVTIKYTANNYDFGITGNAEKLLRVMDSFPIGQYMQSIEVSDFAMSSEDSISTVLWIPSSEPDILEREKEASKVRVAISAGNIHHDKDLPKVFLHLSRLKSISLRISGYDLDWDQYENQHNICELFAKPTLSEIKLSGVTNIPLTALEKATKLVKLSLSNYGILFEELPLTSVERPRTLLDTLQLKNVKYNAQEVAAYLKSRDSTINVTNLQEFETDITNQDDVAVAAAVMCTCTHIKVLQISMLFHHVARGAIASTLSLDDIELSRLHELRHLYLRLSFRDGDETELNWAIRLLSTLPSDNSLTSIYIKIDVGPSGSEAYVHEDYKELLEKYRQWDNLVELLLNRKPGTSKTVNVVISPPDDFHKYDPERCWTLHDCAPAFRNLGKADGLEFRMHEMPVYTVKYVGMDKSFTYN